MPGTHVASRLVETTALLSAGGAASLLSAFNARAQAEPDAPVRIGYLPITDAAPLLVAHNNGLFDKAGVKAEAHAAAQLGAGDRGLHLGQVNVVHLLSPMTVWARFGSQVPAKVVAWNHVGGSGLTVTPEINSVKDLGGKTVAIPFWYSIHNVVLQYLLRENGLTPVSRKDGAGGGRGQPDRDGAGRHAAGAGAKRIAGYIVAEPFNAAAETLGVGKVLRFTGDVWRNHACCVVFMHERDLEQRPQWSQKVVDAIVQAQLWIRDNREETARLLSKEGINRYTPHGLPALSKVLAPPPEDRERYLASGAIRHGDWDERRIDFQPYPFPSYTEELVRRLRDTLIEADRGFLATLDPARAAAELVDDRYVKRAIEAAGGLGRFGFPESYVRSEQVQA